MLLMAFHGSDASRPRQSGPAPCRSSRPSARRTASSGPPSPGAARRLVDGRAPHHAFPVRTAAAPGCRGTYRLLRGRSPGWPMPVNGGRLAEADDARPAATSHRRPLEADVQLFHVPALPLKSDPGVARGTRDGGNGSTTSGATPAIAAGGTWHTGEHGIGPCHNRGLPGSTKAGAVRGDDVQRIKLAA